MKLANRNSSHCQSAMRVPLWGSVFVAAAILCGLPSISRAALVGTILTPPGTAVAPGLVPSGTSAGTLLANLSSPFSFSSVSGTTSGTVISAVYKESGGTLDFYYQIAVSPSSTDPVADESDVTFAGFSTALGFRTDGAGLSGPGFVNGTVSPVTGDRDAAGDVINFSFQPPDTSEIYPGTTSNVLVISTNATQFAAGNVSVIGGAAGTVASFRPIPVPEPASLALAAAIATFGLMRRRARNNT